MINNDRIVPVTATDLVSLYGVILSAAGKTLTVANATNPAQFEITAASTDLIASEPIATCDFASGVSSANLYFVPAYDYTGFTVAGESVEATGDVVADGKTLYLAALSSGAITITQVGF